MKGDGEDIDQSPEEIEADKILEETTNEIQRLQEQMDNLPYDKGPSPKLNPPGMSGGNTGNSRQNKSDNLWSEIEQQKKLAKEKIEGLSKDSDAAIKEKIGTKYQKWNSRYDPQNSVDKKDSITPSQERANKLLDKQDRQPPTVKNNFAKDFWAENREEVIKPETKDTKTNDRSMVMEFDLKFGYPDQEKDLQDILKKDGGPEVAEPDKNTEPSKEIDDPDPEPDI